MGIDDLFSFGVRGTITKVVKSYVSAFVADYINNMPMDKIRDRAKSTIERNYDPSNIDPDTKDEYEECGKAILSVSEKLGDSLGRDGNTITSALFGVVCELGKDYKDDPAALGCYINSFHMATQVTSFANKLDDKITEAESNGTEITKELVTSWMKSATTSAAISTVTGAAKSRELPDAPSSSKSNDGAEMSM